MDAPRRDMELLSNSLAAYAHIRANPESFGLYFVLGVCFGLLLTLCLLVISISCAPRSRPRGLVPHRAPRGSTLEPEDDEDDEDDEDTVTRLGADDTLQGPELSPEPDGTLSINVFTSAEELERAQRLEERERILREIWRTGQPDLLGSGTLGPSTAGTGTLGRVHYY
ncbi:protein eva-1 homolog B isoform X1 [Ochotona princeps]|uniref:protein eva-1 homolog B isoform X1 n=1 Tax=Ochotona princeps TaxID=9978 RepID=UPI002714F609|nr:protein eva-1 homolog B isoform X1 [Ochotona princeps]XP_058516818.1 protein eva-1 homolog B isoform X1 [Ochotona princeps]XP_058516819.1 protein eva-1 homolog B isoform X1 [Ochotona princeps]